MRRTGENNPTKEMWRELKRRTESAYPDFKLNYYIDKDVSRETVLILYGARASEIRC